MDRAMDAMLDAKMNEDGDDFHDDFDDLEDGVLEDEDGFSLLEPTPRLHAGKKSGGVELELIYYRYYKVRDRTKLWLNKLVSLEP